MPRAGAGATSAEQRAALEAFCPERFAFRPDRGGWVKDFDGLGTVVVAPLAWRHAHAPSYAYDGEERRRTDALNLLVDLQQRTWGLPPADVVPANMLAILPDTGGSVLVAYERRRGFSADGWLGFAIAVGSRSGTLVSHMLGVRDDARGAADIGWHLKVIQGYEALRSGHACATWTFDPMRGANARLNIEKLGAQADTFTIDKYGVLRSALYGEEVPTDRLTARWDLVAPATAERLARVASGHHRGPTPDDVADVPEATAESLSRLRQARPPRLRYRIPGDIDRLAQSAPGEALRWRREMREVLSTFLTTVSARVNGDGVGDPLAVGIAEQAGDYVITGFATGQDRTGERVSHYLLERRPA